MAAFNEKNDKIEKKRLLILSVLKEAGEPLGSQKITEILESRHYEISERTVRFHLKELDKLGLTECIGREGRQITAKGLAELSHSRIFEKIGFLAAKIDEMSYRMKFDLAKRQGTVVINLSLVNFQELLGREHLMMAVFEAGYSMGRLLSLFEPGERVGELEVPPGMLGIGTVCSITFNGVLIAHGIPVCSRFGGLLEYANFKPQRFTAIINYDGTTLDPLEIFIKSGMTNYSGAVKNGTGCIGASFRELPASSRGQVLDLAGELEEVGLGGLLEVGYSGRDLFDIPVSEGRLGAVVIGGLNPVAILEENGIKVFSRALSALLEFKQLFPYTEIPERLAKMAKRVNAL